MNIEGNVAVGPDLGGAGLERFFLIEDEGEHFVIDGDVLQGFFGGVAIDGGYGGDGLTREADGIVKRIAALFGDLLDVLGVLASAGPRAGAEDVFAVLVGDDGFDAGQGLGLRGVDTADARVRVGAAQDARVEHAGKVDVERVRGLAGDALAGVDAGGGVANGFEGLDGRGGGIVDLDDFGVDGGAGYGEGGGDVAVCSWSSGR